MSTVVIICPATALEPAPILTPTLEAAQRVVEFFTAQINNDNTRRAYLNATRRGDPGLAIRCMMTSFIMHNFGR